LELFIVTNWLIVPVKDWALVKMRVIFLRTFFADPFFSIKEKEKKILL
jgi:hypothetical protein